MKDKQTPGMERHQESDIKIPLDEYNRNWDNGGFEERLDLLRYLNIDANSKNGKELIHKSYSELPKHLRIELTKLQHKELDKIEKLMNVKGEKYDVSAFHPLAFEDGLYTVRFHEHGKDYLDRYTNSTMVKAKNSTEAIEKAKIELFGKSDKYRSLEVGGMGHTFDSLEEVQKYYKNFPEDTYKYSKIDD